ncbi:MAG: gamma-glutamylcyclotransferase [Okeania sp. SIO3I5]|uniref:gamma-glutamylcyclotransferase family protein n=1 Tax=Okeania sp. SIO3I5 TaxID=2607805 RepID=UPI0013B9FAAD|nr:gamma-glutamylcyclotransferase family protein [Okeania sp. SIO3I5]NEQ39052.1 gamma-glutamylcyclotransferase [Okeania sp. SIO3I5]
MPSNAEQFLSSTSNIKYFAYGSNLSKSLLEFKLSSNPQTKEIYKTKPNLLILNSQPALLKNFELRFNLHVTINNIDPSYANLVYKKDSIVHGCLYEISPECKEVIDGLEAKGNIYQEENLQVFPYHSTKAITAVAYIAYDQEIKFQNLTIQEGIPPSKRYLKTIIAGAQECNLEPEWIEFLKCQPVATIPITKLNSEELKKINEKVYTSQDLESSNFPLNEVFNEQEQIIKPVVSSICGLVFMCNPNQGFSIGSKLWIEQILGKDMTVFYARRCSRNEGVSLYETEQDVLSADRDCLDYVVANVCDLLLQSRKEGEGIFLLGRTTNFHLWQDYLVSIS